MRSISVRRANLGYTTGLVCIPCGEKYPLEEHYRPCLRCGGPLLLDYDLEKISDRIVKSAFRDRGWGVWRYLELLPEIDDKKVVSLGEGGTALLKCERLAQALGLRKLLVKDETTNPTGSFLDRGMTVDVSKANELGFRSLRCLGVSGNFAASATAYASRGGFNCTIHLPRESIERIDLGKLYQIIAYGADLIVENRGIDDQELDFLSKSSYTLLPGNPFFAEGEKTAGYEICEQLGWRTPDRIIVPMGHGEHISMIWRGIKELRHIGLIKEQDVAMTGVQVENYAVIVDQLHGRKVAGRSTDGIKTVATDLAMKKPTHEYLAIHSMVESKGEGVKVKDIEVLDAMSLLARTEGVFAEPAAASTIAGLKMLIDQGHVHKSEEVVCVITGAGLKDPLTARRFMKKVRAVDRIISQIESRRFTTRLGRTKLEILETISRRETYGYEVWRMLRKKLGVDMDVSCVYQHLSELEKVGLIRRTKVESVLGKPERYYYSLTDRGKAITKSTKARALAENGRMMPEGSVDIR
jgi:threonine synthase